MTVESTPIPRAHDRLVLAMQMIDGLRDDADANYESHDCLDMVRILLLSVLDDVVATTGLPI